MYRRLMFCLLLGVSWFVCENGILGEKGFAAGPVAAQAQTFTLSGRVTEPPSGTGVGIPNVTMNLTLNGVVQPTTLTNNNGDYSFSNIPGGTSYEVAPSKTGLVFNPASQGGVLTQNSTAFFTSSTSSGGNSIQFSSSTATVSEAPNVTSKVDLTVTRVGDIAASASVNYATSDVTASERSDYSTAIGVLRFAGGENSKTITVFIVNDSYGESTETFHVTLSNPIGATLGAPSVATVTINSDETVDGPNPVVPGSFDTDFFVRQHYVDFFNREADPSGLAFWKDQIDGCTPAPQCLEIRKINVSAAFFVSIEFQQTGYLVERLYKTAYGDAVGTSTFNGTHQLAVPIIRLNEFFADTQQIGKGVIIGQPGADQILENNKQALTGEFVQRARFLSAFPLSMSAAQFVDTLNANAGNPLSTAERDQLVTDLSGGAKSRAQVLRTVAEDADLFSAEKNRAFVLSQYFGYLRRNPNDAPETGLDYTGYDFWLTKLNQFNGNYINAEMVKAFITSTEYIKRFGP